MIICFDKKALGINNFVQDFVPSQPEAEPERDRAIFAGLGVFGFDSCKEKSDSSAVSLEPGFGSGKIHSKIFLCGILQSRN